MLNINKNVRKTRQFLPFSALTLTNLLNPFKSCIKFIYSKWILITYCFILHPAGRRNQGRVRSDNR